MQVQDGEIRELQAARNEMESYILEMRMAPRQKHGAAIDSVQLNQLLDGSEGWLWDYADTATLAEIQAKVTVLKDGAASLCTEYFEKTEADKKEVERELEEEAAQAAAEKAAEGDDDDHDTRKLKKPERMRMVVKNKEEGTELFKGGNFRYD